MTKGSLWGYCTRSRSALVNVILLSSDKPYHGFFAIGWTEHLPDDTDLPSDTILKVMVICGPNPMNNSQRKFLLQGIISFIIALVKPWIRSNLSFLYIRLLLINKLLKCPI